MIGRTTRVSTSVIMGGIALFWVVGLILPLMRMLTNTSAADIIKSISSRNISSAIWQSLQVSVVATLFSVGLAGLLAWCVVRTGIRFRSAFSVLFTVPMLIPSISHGMALVILLGKNGILTNLFGISGSIYGFWGIVVGSVMYAFPVAFLMISDVLRYEDSTPYEAATVLGISKARQFWAITLPYMRKPLISTVFAVFSMIVTDYGVPLMVGGKWNTLPVVMYQEVIGLLDFKKGSAIGLLLLLPALVAFIFDWLNRDRGNLAFVSKPFVVAKSRPRDMFGYVCCALAGCFCLVPVIAFAVLSFVRKYPVDMTLTLDNVRKTMEKGAAGYLSNSIMIALLVSVLGVLAAILVAFITARNAKRFARSLHLLSITSLAVPGIVLGLSFVLFFKSSFIYGTMAILILVNIMHFFASPYLMIYNSFGKINASLEDVGQSLGVGRFRVLIDILIPQCKTTIAEMFSYFFVNSMMTISAVSFLATVSTKPLALMITQFEANMVLEGAAFVSLLIFAFNLLMKVIVYRIKKRH